MTGERGKGYKGKELKECREGNGWNGSTGMRGMKVELRQNERMIVNEEKGGWVGVGQRRTDGGYDREG